MIDFGVFEGCLAFKPLEDTTQVMIVPDTKENSDKLNSFVKLHSLTPFYLNKPSPMFDLIPVLTMEPDYAANDPFNRGIRG